MNAAAASAMSPVVPARIWVRFSRWIAASTLDAPTSSRHDLLGHGHSERAVLQSVRASSRAASSSVVVGHDPRDESDALRLGGVERRVRWDQLVARAAPISRGSV